MAITNEEKEHLRKLLHGFLANAEFRKQKTAYTREGAMLATLCAVYGKFDFSVVLEHFSELVRADRYLKDDTFGGTLDWQRVAAHCALYWYSDIRLIGGLGSSSSGRLDRMNWLFFESSYCDYKKLGMEKDKARRKIFPAFCLPDHLEAAISKDDGKALCAALKTAKDRDVLLRNSAYSALVNDKYRAFAALYRTFDLAATLDMERVFEFWSRIVLDEQYRFGAETEHDGQDFLREWRAREEYPLHRMILDWDTGGRCVPALFRYGLLFPEVMTELWERGMPFDKPLAPFAGWGELTFPAFARYFGEFSADFAPFRGEVIQNGEKIFLANLEAAEFYQANFAGKTRPGHPVAAAAKKAPAPGKSGSLTEEQKNRLADETANGVVFSADGRTLKEYTWEADTVKKYEVPDFVRTIAGGAFSEADKLEHLVLPEGLTRICKEAFAWGDIKKIELPSTVKRIAPEAFWACDKLTDVTIPEGVCEIGESAFRSCDGLKEVVLPDSMAKIGPAAFGKCKNLRRIEIPEGCEVSPGAFVDDRDDLEVVYRPKKEK